MHKVRYLDGLRGVAAFIVVLHHFAAAFYPAAYLGLDLAQHSPFEPWLLTTPLGLLIAGNFSVCIFFILSGFVLTNSFFRSGDGKSLSSLAVRRYFRLLPPVIVSGFAGWLLMTLDLFPVARTAALTGSTRWLSQCWAFEPDFGKLLGESFYGVFFAHQCSYNNVLWTMTWEFFGSFLVFGIAGLFGKVRSRPVIYAILAVLLFRSYYLAFLIGLVLSDIAANRPRWFSRISGAPVTVVLVILGIYLGTFPPFMDIQSPWYAWLKFPFLGASAPQFWHILGALFLMLSVLSSPGLQGFFSTAPALFLGKVSFSLYAIHVLVIGSFSCLLFLALSPHLAYNAAALVTLGATVLLSLALADLVNRFIDEPGIRLSKTIQSRFFPL
jgi:Predicted acyltransferases